MAPVLKLRHESVSVDDIKLGDHIFAHTKIWSGVVIQHHGIVVKGRVVYKVTSFTAAHKSGTAGNGHIHTEDLRHFAAGKQLYRVIYPSSEQVFRPEWVEYRAKHLEKHPEEFGEYDAITNNCEQFCTFCKAGIRQSDQATVAGTASIVTRSVRGQYA